MCVWRRGSLKRIPTTTRILLGALIPQNLKHINFSWQNSEKAVNGAQILFEMVYPQRKVEVEEKSFT